MADIGRTPRGLIALLGVMLLVSLAPMVARAQTNGAGRVLGCEPEYAGAFPRGTATSFTCTVTDGTGAPVPGVDVTFAMQGPGSITSTGTTPAPDNDAPGGHEYRTNDRGRVTIVVGTTASDPWGTTTITGRISGQAPGEPAATAECARSADDPPGAPAGVCEDVVTVTWETDQPAPAECEDGIDNDGDGNVDHPNDVDCATRDDRMEAYVHSDPPRSNLTIRYFAREKVFRGAVGSQQELCIADRKVVLKRFQRGPNPAIGKDLTNGDGVWRIPRDARPGRYYAKVGYATRATSQGQTIECLRDRSVTIEIP